MKKYKFNDKYVLQRTRQVDLVERLMYNNGELVKTSVESEWDYTPNEIYHIVDKTVKYSPFVMNKVTRQIGFDTDEILAVITRYTRKGRLFEDAQSFVTNDLFETNDDYKARDLIIFGRPAPYETLANIASFGSLGNEKYNVSLQTLRQLIDGNHVDLYGDINGRPSVSELLAFMTKYPSFQLTGSVTRGDVIFDGILSHSVPKPDTQAVLDFENLGADFRHYIKPDVAYVRFE